VSISWHRITEIGIERGLLAGNKGAIVDVMGNPSTLEELPRPGGGSSAAYHPSTSAPPGQWGGVCHLSKGGVARSGEEGMPRGRLSEIYVQNVAIKWLASYYQQKPEVQVVLPQAEVGVSSKSKLGRGRADGLIAVLLSDGSV
jgi:hypothetical protein